MSSASELIHQMQLSKHTSLLSVLLEGDSGTGVQAVRALPAAYSPSSPFCPTPYRQDGHCCYPRASISAPLRQADLAEFHDRRERGGQGVHHCEGFRRRSQIATEHGEIEGLAQAQWHSDARKTPPNVAPGPRPARWSSTTWNGCWSSSASARAFPTWYAPSAHDLNTPCGRILSTSYV